MTLVDALKEKTAMRVDCHGCAGSPAACDGCVMTAFHEAAPGTAVELSVADPPRKAPSDHLNTAERAAVAALMAAGLIERVEVIPMRAVLTGGAWMLTAS